MNDHSKLFDAIKSLELLDSLFLQLDEGTNKDFLANIASSNKAIFIDKYLFYLNQWRDNLNDADWNLFKTKYNQLYLFLIDMYASIFKASVESNVICTIDDIGHLLSHFPKNVDVSYFQNEINKLPENALVSMNYPFCLSIDLVIEESPSLWLKLISESCYLRCGILFSPHHYLEKNPDKLIKAFKAQESKISGRKGTKEAAKIAISNIVKDLEIDGSRKTVATTLFQHIIELDKEIFKQAKVLGVKASTFYFKKLPKLEAFIDGKCELTLKEADRNKLIANIEGRLLNYWSDIPFFNSHSRKNL